MIVLVYCILSLFNCMLFVFPRPYVIQFLLPWDDIAYFKAVKHQLTNCVCTCSCRSSSAAVLRNTSGTRARQTWTVSSTHEHAMLVATADMCAVSRWACHVTVSQSFYLAERQLMSVF